MAIVIHFHARERMEERGATYDEVRTTIQKGEKFQARFGRMGFRYDFPFESRRNGRFYRNKQIEVYGISEGGDFVVITVVVKYF
jgi:adenylate cyclase class IV